MAINGVLMTVSGISGHLQRLAPGQSPFPLHFHHIGEEHVVVLRGVVTVQERLPDGTRREFDLVAGELVAWPAGTGLAHRLFNRSLDEVELLVVSDVSTGEICEYPDSGKSMVRGLGVGVWSGRAPGAAAEAPPDPARIHAEARAACAAAPVTCLGPLQRPDHVAGLELETRELGSGGRRFFGRPLSRSAGARRLFVNWDTLPAGCHFSPLHRHTQDEEWLYLVSGALDLRQVTGDGAEQRCRLQPGDLVRWLPDQEAHQVTNPGPEDAVCVVMGTDSPGDVTFFPERGEAYVPALGEVGRLLPTPYWAGEGASRPNGGRSE